MHKIVPILPLPDWLDAELWEDFIKYRIEIDSKGKGMTDTAKKRMIMRLERLFNQGGHVETMIERTIFSKKEWSNIYFSKEEVLDEQTNTNSRFNKPKTGADILAERLATIQSE